MKNFSLKLRLMLVFTVFFALIGTICGIVSWFEAKESTDEFFDTYQMALARNLSSADWQNINYEIQQHTNFELKNIKYADEDDEAIGFAVFDLSGKMVFHDNENGKNFIFRDRTGAFLTEKVDDDLWRIIRVKSADNKYIIAIGQELEYRSDVAWDLIEEFMLPWLIGLFILLLFMLLIIEREFMPLKKAALQIKNRKPEDLYAVESTSFPKEVMPLVDAINELFKKLEQMLQSEKRFVADAAHELRTPLTALKIQLDVLQLCADDTKAKNKAMDNLEQGLLRASHLVEQLLTLSKIENSLAESIDNNQKIDWKSITKMLMTDYSDMIKQKQLVVDDSNLMQKGPVLVGNQALIITVIKNLIENAIKYSPESANIQISSNDGIFIVYNSGIKIKEQYIENLGKRFYRPSGNNEKGSGLGLSIVKLITTYYGCKLNFANKNNGFEVKISKL